MNQLAARSCCRHADEPFGGPIEKSDPQVGPDGHHSAFNSAYDSLKLVVELNHSLVCLSVSDCYRRLVCERGKKVDIVTKVWIVEGFGAERQESDDPTVLDQGCDDVNTETV